MATPEEIARQLAAEAVAADDPTGWFERVYAAAEAGETQVPWDRAAPNRLLVQWATDGGLSGGGRRAVVVGCGLGDDAEFVAGLGFATTAFDISATAVRAARRRYPDSRVSYATADLLSLPAAWLESFDLVVESMTLQALPDPPRAAAITSVGRLVAPGRHADRHRPGPRARRPRRWPAVGADPRRDRRAGRLRAAAGARRGPARPRAAIRAALAGRAHAPGGPPPMTAPARPARPPRPTQADLAAARELTIPDVAAPGLRVLFSGINPGLYSAATGYHFARPGNRFWPALHRSGFTPRQLDPSEQDQLLGLGLGITNVVARATARADELSRRRAARGRPGC